MKNVSRPELARRAGLTDWPGFDLLSLRPESGRRAIEVKGRAGVGEIELSENEWAKACNLRDQYWLYVAFNCASPRPRLVRVRDPFRNLLVKAKGNVVIPSAEVLSAAKRRASNALGRQSRRPVTALRGFRRLATPRSCRSRNWQDIHTYRRIARILEIGVGASADLGLYFHPHCCRRPKTRTG